MYTMSAVEWNKKEELVADQAMKHIKVYCPVLATVAKSGKAELTLMVKIQEYCYGNVNFMKSFQKIIVMLYKSKIVYVAIAILLYFDHQGQFCLATLGHGG
jgi:hypothetical protein